MKYLALIVITLLLVQCEPLVPQQSVVNKKLFFDDYDYESLVGNVQLVPMRGNQIDYIGNPVISLRQPQYLYLVFDLLTDQFENLSAKLYHCNKDWKRSVLRDMEFVSEINNFRITDFSYSVNTVQPYINYTFTVPKPNVSGNYVLVVHRRARPDDILFSRKFLVVDNVVDIDQLVKVSSNVSQRNSNQEVQFSMDYGDLLVNAPAQDIQPMILQNHNWNTALSGFTPSLIRQNDGYLEYEYFDLTTNFKGWNEFRFADLRTLDVNGRNVGRITKNSMSIQSQLALFEPRKGEPYTLNFQDINGRYILGNNDAGESTINSDYTTARFYLKSDFIPGDIYVTGRFNNWKLSERNKMRYDRANGLYFADIFLKQGYYEFMFLVQSASLPPYYLEGSHFQAENEYELVIYYRKPGNMNDEIIGYRKFDSIDDSTWN